MSVDGPQLAPAVRRGEERAESQVELGQGLGRRNETRLVNSDGETVWNTAWSRRVALAWGHCFQAALRSSQSRKQGG